MFIDSVFDAVFPLAEHGGVLLFVGVDLPLVLELGQLGCSLFIHFLLQVLPLDAVLFIHLLEDVHLVVLSGRRLLCGSRLVLGVLLSDSSFNLCLFVCSLPLLLPLLLLLGEDVFFTVDVDVLQEVDASLLFSLPLRVPHLLLSFGLLLHVLVHLFLVNGLVALSLLVVLLQFYNFISSAILFVCKTATRYLASSTSSTKGMTFR